MGFPRDPPRLQSARLKEISLNDSKILKLAATSNQSSSHVLPHYTNAIDTVGNYTPYPPLTRTYAMSDVLSCPPQAPANPFEDMTLGDAMKNKHVKELFDNYIQATNRAMVLASELSEASKKCCELQREITEMQNRHIGSWDGILEKDRLSPFTQDSVLYPSDSASQEPTMLPTELNFSAPATLVDQPVVRPAKYPEEVLWNREDVKNSPAITFSTQNQSRPPTQRCLRTPTGTIISDSQWMDIRLSANAVIRDVLVPLMQRSPNSVYRKQYFKGNWPTEWMDAVARIEARQPLLTLCSFHWKAELVLVHCLDLIKSSKKDKPGSTALPSSLPSPPETTTPLVQVKLAAASSPQCSGIVVPPQPRPATPPPPQTSAPCQPQPAAPSQLEHSGPSEPRTAVPPSESAAAPSPLKFSKHKMDPNSPVVPVKKKRTMIPLIVLPTDKGEETGKIDISGIEVTASYEALKEIVAGDSNFQQVPHATDLLEALRKVPATAERPSTAAVEQFLAEVEQADPNAPDVDEDNTNASWGHYHFRSGAVRFDNLTWEMVANKQTAYRILAATIKTCRVARHLCLKHNITTNGVVADMYLETIVQKLWKHFELVAADSPSSLDVPAPTSLEDISAEPAALERSKLENLRVAQLKTLAQDLNVSVPRSKKGKTLTKNDYIVALASTPGINEHLASYDLK